MGAKKTEERKFIGDALKKARESLSGERYMSARVAADQLAKMLDRRVTRGMLSHRENNLQATELSFALAAEKLYKVPLTHVYQNGTVDGVIADRAPDAAPLDLSSIAKFERQQIWAGATSKPYSVRSLRPVIKELSVSLGDARTRILDEDVPPAKKGQAVCFVLDPYPHETPWLLLLSKEDPDTELIAHLDPQDSGSVIDASGARWPIAKFQVIGWMYAVAWGLGDRFHNFNARGDGIGPHSRL